MGTSILAVAEITNQIAITNQATQSFPFNINWETPEGITALATCLAALFALLALMSVALLNRQIRADHDRSRRERAVDLMMCYVTTHDPSNHQIVFGLNLSFVLTEEQCHSLWEREPFAVLDKHQHLLDTWRTACNSSLNGSKSRKSPGDGSSNSVLTLSASEVYMLRSIATNFLNKLELVASAWNNNVADRAIIEQEFVRVFCPKDGVYVLEKFRDASGIYPSIGKICEHLKQKKSQSITAMPPVA
jgi:hypothetical protein